jgi:hypothetical protein
MFIGGHKSIGASANRVHEVATFQIAISLREFDFSNCDLTFLIDFQEFVLPQTIFPPGIS